MTRGPRDPRPPAPSRAAATAAVLTAPGDPWTSTFAFALEALRILDPRGTRRLARDLPWPRLDADRRETLVDLGLAGPRRKPPRAVRGS